MQRSRRTVSAGKVWVPVVLIVGLTIGILIASVPTPLYGPMPRRGHHFGPHFETADDVVVILSTLSIILLIALVAVYTRIYAETRATFAVGLVTVFIALLLQSIATSPLVYGAFGQASGGLGGFLLLADIFKVTAFTILLYLSLE
jgi:hypothetical protein